MVFMVSIWGITDRGTVRQQNQDDYAFRLAGSRRGYGVVCDGMGGARAGNIASRLAVDAFQEVMERQGEDQWEAEPRTVLFSAADQANLLVYRKAREDQACRGMGTTMVAALLLGHTAYLLNVGDSRAYYITPEGISRVTRDHSVVEDLVCRGELTPEQARQHPQKNLITRALGAEERVRADLYQIEAQEGCFLLLCSDGLSNIVSDQEILYEVLHGGDASDCCNRLLEIALSRGAPDNVTAVLFQL